MRKKILLGIIGMYMVKTILASASPSPPGDNRRDEVLEAINWQYPGLEQAAAKWRSGDKRGAAALLVNYLRRRPASGVKASGRYNRLRAEQGLKGIWTYGANSHQFPSGKIDWFYNKTREVPGMLDNEWQWQLNRMRWFADMAAAYRVSGDPAYPSAFVRQLRSWARQCPMPEKVDNGANSAWRTIDTGIRLAWFWPPAYAAFITSPEFTDDDVILYLYLSLEQMRYLLKYYTSGNWLTLEMNGIYTFAATFPEFTGAAAARRRALEIMYENLKKMLLPDGMLDELTVSYHQMVVKQASDIIDLAHKYKRDGELPKGFIALLEKAYECQIHCMTPDFGTPLGNDSRHTGLNPHFRPSVRLFPERKGFLWVQSRGKKGVQPKFLSSFLPWAGLIAMRSSWDADANCLTFDVGPLGMRHQHYDKLNISIWKGGEQLLFDDGGGSYAQSSFRRYARSSLGHNLVSVDGLPQTMESTPANRRVSAPINASWTTTAGSDFAMAEFKQGWGSPRNRIARHFRQVLFIRPDIFLVFDRMRSMDGKSHAYQARWHFDVTEMEPLLPGHPALITGAATTGAGRFRQSDPAKRARLIAAPLLTAGLKSQWVCGKDKGKWNELAGIYVQHPYRKAVTVTHDRLGDGDQFFLTMFIPLAPGAVPPIVKIVQNGNYGAEVTFKGGSVMTIILPEKPRERMRAFLR